MDLRDELLILLPHRHPGGALRNDTHDELIGEGDQVFFHLLPADAPIDIHHKDLIFPHRVEDLNKALLPGIVGLFVGQCLGSVLHAGPFHQVVDILEVIVEGHAADAAVLGDIADGDFGKRFFPQQVFQRLLQRAFGDLGHGASPSGSIFYYYSMRRPYRSSGFL